MLKECIIGAGNCGCQIAKLASERGLNVLGMNTSEPIGFFR